jgi:hypothetical protein
MMEFGDLIRPGVGAVVGFLLAQLVNVAVLVWRRRQRPRLVIELPDERSKVLAHSTEARQGEILREEIYGFYVRNVGRRLATGVRFQLIKIEHRRSERHLFSEISDHAFELTLYPAFPE